jgi:hypothetical protein
MASLLVVDAGHRRYPERELRELAAGLAQEARAS